jgi:hypothetical protein
MPDSLGRNRGRKGVPWYLARFSAYAGRFTENPTLRALGRKPYREMTAVRRAGFARCLALITLRFNDKD